MSRVTFAKTGPVITKKRIREVETEIGCKFPDDYRAFLLKHNGGKPIPSILTIPVLNEKIAVGLLFGIDRPVDILKVMKEFSGEMPECFIPIGRDPGANIILMDASPNSSGDIYYWDHTHFFRRSSSSGNTYHVAKSFSDFIEQLHLETP